MEQVQNRGTFRVTTRPGNVIVIQTENVGIFADIRAAYPYHKTVSFVQRTDGRVAAILTPLENVIPINGKYLQLEAA